LVEGRRETYSPLTLSSGVWKHENQPFWQQASGDLGTTTASWEGGSSIAGASTMGVVATYFFGFSLSLKKEQKSKTLCTSRKKEKYINKSAKDSQVQEVEKLFFIL
jgi:hypothetical protein